MTLSSITVGCQMTRNLVSLTRIVIKIIPGIVSSITQLEGPNTSSSLLL